MSSATKLPNSTAMKFFDWKGDPIFERNPSLESGGTYYLKWSTPPKDENEAIITGAFLVTGAAKSGQTYTFWVPAGAVSADGLSATGCVGGIRPNGLDYTTGDTDFAPTSTTILAGMKITCGIPAVLGELLRAAVQGVIQTGSVSINIGTGSSEDAYIYHNGNPWLKQTSAGVAQYYNGSSYVNISDTQTSVTQKVSSADTTPDYLYNKIDVATDGELTKAIGNPAGAETLQLGLATTLTKAEMDALHTGISANVTGTNLATLTAGGASNADGLHTHDSLSIASGTAGEAIDGSSTPVVVAKMANNYKDYVYPCVGTQPLFTNTGATAVAFGNTDATARVAMSFVKTDALAASITLEDMKMPILKTLAPADTYYVEIQTDSGGSPSGTVITNGTSTALSSASATTTNFELRTFVFATPPTITSGTTYWAVLRRSGAVDATNYLSTYRLSDVSGYVSKTYTASTGLWSSALATDMNWTFTFNIDYDGKIVKASNTDLKRANVVGVTKSNVAAGASLTYYTTGAIVTGFTGLTEGVDYYASTSGAYTSSPTFAAVAGDVAATSVLLPVFTAVSATAVAVSLKTKYSMIAVGSNNLISAQAASSDLDMDFPISCGFKPVYIDIYRFAGSLSIAEIIRTIRGSKYTDVTTWSNTASTFYSIPTILENGVTLRVQLDGVDNNAFGGVLILKDA